MKFNKIIVLCLSMILVSILFFVGVSGAQTFQTGDIVTVAESETVDGMLFAGGNTIDIAGIVNGDVYCAGNTVNVSGKINGDLICASQTMTISGIVDGSVRIAGQSINISGTIGNSATIGAQTLIIDKDGSITRDLLGGSQTTTISGTVGRDILAGSQSITINGKVGRDFRGETASFAVGNSGRILGNVDYTSNQEINVLTGGVISGTVKRTAPPAENHTVVIAPIALTFGWFIYSLVALLAVALVLIGLFPRIFKEASASAKKKPGSTVLMGLGVAFLTPIIVGLLMITIIGIPLAFMILLVMTMAAALSGPFAGYLLGNIIMPKSNSTVWKMLAGSALLIVTFFIPILGFFTILVSYLFGMGMVVKTSCRISHVFRT